MPGHKRPRNDFRLQTCRHLDRLDVTREHGIPVTTVARTLVDLTDVLTTPQLANVIHEAAFRKQQAHCLARAAERVVQPSRRHFRPAAAEERRCHDERWWEPHGRWGWRE